MDVDAVAGYSSRLFFFLASISVDTGLDLCTFLVRGMMQDKVGQGCLEINGIEYWVLWESARLVMAKR